MEIVQVLLLEDHEGEARLNQRLLERSYTTEFHFESFRTLHEALASLEGGNYDVALLDLNLPDSKGIDTFLALQTAAPELPVVIVSAVADDRLARAAIRHGAQDYLVKGSITSETLTRVVGYAIARKQAAGLSGRISLHADNPELPLSASFALDAEGNICLAAAQLARLFEQTDPFALLYKPILSFIDPLDTPRVTAALTRVQRSGSAETLIAHAAAPKGPGGRLLIILSRVSTGTDSGLVQGTVVAAPAGVDEDSEGKEMETRYRALVEHSQDGVFVLSDGKIVFANAALADMLGYEAEELVDKEIVNLVAPEDHELVLSNYRRRVAGEEVGGRYDFTALHRNGSRLRVQLSVGRIPLKDGIGVMGTLKNITEQYRVSYLMRLQHRLAIELAHSQQREEIYDHVLQGVLRIENIDLAAIYVQDPDTGTFHQAAWRGLCGPFPSAASQAVFDQVHNRLVRETTPLYLDAESLSDDRIGKMLSPEGIRAFGLIPVLHGGLSIAALDVASLTAERFDEPVQRTLESIASFLGGVLARMLAEEARKESDLLYRAVVEKSHDAIFIYRDDHLVFVNEKTLALTGYTRDELASLNPWTLIHPDDRQRIQSVAAQRLEGSKAPIVYEGRILTKDGTIRTGEFATTLIRYEGEAAALVTVRDITSRKSQEEELKRSDALIRAAGFAAARFLRTADWKDSIMEVLERFGAAANVCRLVIFENVPDENGARIMRQRAVWVRPEMRDSMIDRVPDGQSFEDEPFRRWAAELSAGNPIAGIIDNLPDEEQVFLARQNVRSLAVLPVFCGDHWWGIIRFDECRLRRSWLRAELEAMGVSAETLGAAIRRKLAEEQLVASREQAVQADAIKKSFIANISHEVRTPLNIILGYLALVAELMERENGEELQEFVVAINEASLRLIRTVDSILNISRFHAHDIAINSVPLRLDKLLADCGEKFRRQAEEKGLEFVFENTSGAIELRGDQHFLAEAFEHLLDNAVKFTSKGSVALSLTEGQEGEAVVLIADTGIGISETFLERVFDPYLQEDMGYNRMYEGIGLGLTLVKLYLEAHGALINIVSKKGEGTRIEVRFPGFSASAASRHP
ncbi:MAG: PAS domain S-box protein [Bacteroidetes bacterium]|nr:PAS domain S-box protein [Bacteroidota bacterium]